MIGKRKGFTLIEMVVVTIVLGLVITIAVVAVSDYIKKSRKDTYISNAHEYISIASTMLAKQEFVVRDSNTTYYIHINNLDTEKELNESPYGEWEDAYVVVTIDGGTNNFNYYWTSVDSKGYRVDLVNESDLDSNDVYHSNNLTIDTNQKIGNREKIVVYDKDGNRNIK